MVSLTQLEYILAVDKYRHFAKAAEACHVTQPTLSMQLQKLEDELEVIVFDRGKKPILPTDKGSRIIEQARVIVAESRKLVALAKHSEDEVRGDFRLAVIPTLSPYLIPLFLESFSASYPKVKLEIREMQTAQIVDELENESLDAALLATPLHRDGLLEEVLFYEPFYLYVPKAHPLAGKAKVHDEDLDGSEIWLLNEGHCFRSQIIRICSLRSKKPVLRNVQFESGNLETLKRLVETSSGYTLLPYLSLHPRRLISPQVAALEFVRPVPSREISLVHSRRHLKQPILQALQKVILHSLPKELRELKKADLDVVAI